VKTEEHLNGSIQVILIPETPIEQLILSSMAEGASRGKAVRLVAAQAAVAEGEPPRVDRVFVSVEA